MDALTFVLLVLLWCSRIQENTGKFPREYPRVCRRLSWAFLQSSAIADGSCG